MEVSSVHISASVSVLQLFVMKNYSLTFTLAQEVGELTRKEKLKITKRCSFVSERLVYVCDITIVAHITSIDIVMVHLKDVGSS